MNGRVMLAFAALAALPLVGCASASMQAKPESPFAVARQSDIRGYIRPNGEQREMKLVVRASVEGERFLGGAVDAYAAGASVASATFDREGGTSLLLGAGNYEVEATTADGERSVVLGDLLVLRGTCFQENGSSEKPKARYDRLFAFEHEGARVFYPVEAHPDAFGWGHTTPAILRVPRLYAFYGSSAKTRVSWIRDGETVETTDGAVQSLRSGWVHSPSVDHILSYYLWDTSDSTRGNCHSLFDLADESIVVPDEVWRRGGPWTARIVTVGAQVIEVDFDASTAHPDYRFAEDAPKRSLPLAPRVVEATAEERSFLDKEEAELTVEPPMGDAYGNAKPLLVGPALIRAAYREPKFTPALHAFVEARTTANFGSIDRVSSILHGVERGESVASVEQAIAIDQANLDADQNAENAYRKAEAARLRPQLEAWIKKSGGPLSDADYPRMY